MLSVNEMMELDELFIEWQKYNPNASQDVVDNAYQEICALYIEAVQMRYRLPRYMMN